MRKRIWNFLVRRKGLFGALFALLLLLTVFWLSPRFEQDAAPLITPCPSHATEAVVNINTATTQQLQELPGIGPALAARILEYREAHGAFQYTYELTDVEGIGAVTYEKLRELVTVEP